MAEFLSAEHIWKTFNKSPAVQDASLDLQEGEILALLGPNGAGKTTLIKILATLLRKDRGLVKIMGYDLDQHETEIRHLLGYVGQDTERSAYARLTVRENLRYFGSLRGLSRNLVDQQIDKLVTRFEFFESVDKQFVQLSGGQKQTVVIIRAFLHEPPVIYLDEPTKGLDPIISKKIRLFLKETVRQEGKALLLTSHVLSEVDEIASRVGLIEHGSIPITGTPRELKAAIGASEFVELEEYGLSDQTRRKLLDLDDVLFSVEREPGWISLAVNNALSGAEAIIKVLREAGVQVGFRQHSVTLEDAFMHYVGKLPERFDL